MPEEWRLIFAPSAHAFMNMAIDEAIAKSSAESKPTIRFYTWGKPAVSIGYFQRIMPVLNWLNHNLSQESRVKSQELKVKKVSYHPPYSTSDSRLSTLDSQLSTLIDIVRRPTGGGVILHSPVLSEANVTDLTYSVAIKTLTSTRNLIPLFYKQLGRAVIEGLRLLGITASLESGVKSRESRVVNSRLKTQDSGLSLCAQTSVEFDVLVEGIKVAGCAARRFHETLLLQGYISIEQITKMASQQVIDVMVKGFALALDIELVKENLTDDEIALAEELNKNKYSRNEWNYKR